MHSRLQVREQILCGIRSFHLYSVRDPKLTTGPRTFLGVMGQANAEPSHALVEDITPCGIQGVPFPGHEHVRGDDKRSNPSRLPNWMVVARGKRGDQVSGGDRR